jgi:hypothetical protein
VLEDISPLETRVPTINSRAARSPILESVARLKRFLAVSIGFFLMYIVLKAFSTASKIDLS